MTFVITGSTGSFGHHVVTTMLDRGVAPGEVVATGRDLARVADLADRGVQTRRADYEDADSLRAAFDGADVVLLVSGTELGQRVAQHRNAVEAAAQAGVGLLAYTSLAHCDRSGMRIAADHRDTEQTIAESGLPHVLLRNGWYMENYTSQLGSYVLAGAVTGCARDGRVSAATRDELAEAAAAVLLADGQAGAVYELGGDEAFSLTELAAAVTDATGQPVSYLDESPEDFTHTLVRAGLPEPYAESLADADLGIARGDLLVTTGDLSRLLGRPTTSMAAAVHEAARSLTAQD